MFVCTGNTCRSPMAKILMEKMADEKGVYVNVRSRGIVANPMDGISRGTYAVLLKEGIDSSFHQAKLLEEEDMEWADRVYTMTQSQSVTLKAKYFQQEEKIQPLGTSDVPDPFGGRLEIYEATYDVIKEHLENILEEIKGE
nr:hypothetical protein [Peptoniphilus sp. KCTC 25270]